MSNVYFVLLAIFNSLCAFFLSGITAILCCCKGQQQLQWQGQLPNPDVFFSLPSPPRELLPSFLSFGPPCLPSITASLPTTPIPLKDLFVNSTILQICPIPAHQLTLIETVSRRFQTYFNFANPDLPMDCSICSHTFVDKIDFFSSEFYIPGHGYFYHYGYRYVNENECVLIAASMDSSIMYSIITAKLAQLSPAYIV